MGLPSRRRLKKELNRRLIYHPLLRMLLLKAWFRYAFGLAVLLLGGAGLFLPKIWRSTPAGFEPVIRVSWLDYAQAWSLKRAARRQAAAADYAGANYSWQSAVANNAADPEAIRGLLRNLVAADRMDRRSLRLGVGQTLWLIRLGGTNTLDLELAAAFCERHEFHDVAEYALRGVEERLGPRGLASLAKALFNLGKMDEFQLRLARLRSLGELDAEGKLYEAAWHAGWGVGGEAADAREQMERRVREKPDDPLTHRLYLPVCAKRLDPSGYARSLERLDRLNRASLLDHIGYWKLLAGLGRREEAVKLASGHPGSPATSGEVVRFAETSFRLGLKAQALEIIRRFTDDHAYSPEVWTTHGALLLDAGEWLAMRELAARIRSADAVRSVLGGYAFYLEARAEIGMGRANNAGGYFRRAAEYQYDQPLYGLITAADLQRLGRGDLARGLLLRLEEPLGKNAAYWDACATTALELKDAEWFLRAAAAEHTLQPDDPETLNRYAAALILNRQRPEESVKHTFRLVTRYPDSLSAVLNHAVALLQNHRLGEARAQLSRVNADALDSTERAALNLAWFELLLAEGDRAAAVAFSSRVEKSRLFPAQTAWLEARLRGLEDSTEGVPQ